MSGAESYSDSDHQETRTDQRREIFYHTESVIDDDEGSQFDGDTPVIMLDRPLDHHIRAWDLSYGPCLATMRATIGKYAAKLLAFTMMVVIGR